MPSSPPSLESLRATWTQLYAHTLPSLATSKTPVQPTWPVHLDHCFGRIIFDAVIGIDAPWTSKLKGPAVKNMTSAQLQACIALGERIAEGNADLVELDERSLKLRGKTKGKRKCDVDGGDGETKAAKRRVGSGHAKKDGVTEVKESRKGGQLDIRSSMGLPTPPPKDDFPSPPASPAPVDPELATMIKTSDLTAFRQRTLLALCQVPAGHYTTYAALSEFLGSCPRAVGNAMRNNPFAPRVPCHRVVASDGGIGGFGGDWGSEGKHAREKVKLLREERVDVVEERRKGLKILRVKGGVWKGFRQNPD